MNTVRNPGMPPIVLGTPYGTEAQKRAIERSSQESNHPDMSAWRDNPDLPYSERVIAEDAERRRLEELLKKQQLGKLSVRASAELDRLVVGARERKDSRQEHFSFSINNSMIPEALTPLPRHIIERQADSAKIGDLVDLTPPRSSRP